MKIAGAIGGIFGGAAAARRKKKIIDKQEKENQQWYDRRYNEDSTQRADAVAALERQKQAMAERSQNAAGTAAVMGASNESVAAEKAAQTEALAQTTSNIALAGEARKDAIEGQYMQKKDSIAQQRLGVEQAQSDNLSAALGQMGEAASNIATGLIKTKEG